MVHNELSLFEKIGLVSGLELLERIANGITGTSHKNDYLILLKKDVEEIIKKQTDQKRQLNELQNLGGK